MAIKSTDFISRNLKVIGTVKEFTEKVRRLGYDLFIPEGEQKVITIGKKGQAQFQMINSEGRSIMIRISKRLDKKLREGREEVDILNLPIYDLGIDGAPELVLGLSGSDIEIIGDDIQDMSYEEMNNLFSYPQEMKRK